LIPKNFQKLSAGKLWTQCERLNFSQASSVQNANSSHWSIYSDCELRGFSQSDNEYSARIPVSKEKFKKTSKIQSGSVTQKVSQGILETQKFTNQEKKAMGANGHRKFKKPKRQRCSSPVESPILFMDKLVSADTDQSPQIHLDLEQTVTEYYSFPRSKVLNGQEKKDDVLTL
jgi:hypothetical protein